MLLKHKGKQGYPAKLIKMRLWNWSGQRKFILNFLNSFMSFFSNHLLITLDEIFKGIKMLEANRSLHWFSQTNFHQNKISLSNSISSAKHCSFPFLKAITKHNTRTSLPWAVTLWLRSYFDKNNSTSSKFLHEAYNRNDI